MSTSTLHRPRHEIDARARRSPRGVARRDRTRTRKKSQPPTREVTRKTPPNCATRWREPAESAYEARVPTFAERVQGRFVGFLSTLPPPVQRLLAGGGPVRIDGQELAAEYQLVLRLVALAGHRGLAAMTPAQARAEIRRSARVFAAAPPPLARVEDRVVPGPAGPLAARLYVPFDDGVRRPLVVHYHGGGWVIGDLETHDTACRHLAREADVGVLAIDYRLAPEHRFPAAIDDALAAFRWAAAHAAELGCDPARVAVAGDSAGGNLAAVVAQLAARDGGPRPVAQLLAYPVTDVSTKHPSYELFADGFLLTARDMDWFRMHYLPDDATALDPRASPLLAPDLRGLPPAVVLTCGFDVLRDEGEAYARRLEQAGVHVELRRSAGLIHGFCNAVDVSPASRTAMIAGCRLLRDLLAPGSVRAAPDLLETVK
jgi:acetyl esterase